MLGIHARASRPTRTAEAPGPGILAGVSPQTGAGTDEGL